MKRRGIIAWPGLALVVVFSATAAADPQAQPGSQASVSVGAAMVTRGLNAEAVSAALAHELGPVTTCYKQRLAQKPKLAARATVTFTVAGSGEVTGIKVIGLGDAVVEKCLKAAISTVKLARQGDDGGDTIARMARARVPIVFQPRAPTPVAPPSTIPVEDTAQHPEPAVTEQPTPGPETTSTPETEAAPTADAEAAAEPEAEPEAEADAEAEPEPADIDLQSFSGRITRDAAVDFATGIFLSTRHVSFKGPLAAGAPSLGRNRRSVSYGVTSDVEIYPAAYADPRSTLAHLGLYGSFDRQLGDGGGTAEQRIAGGILYRNNVGRRAMLPTFLFGGGVELLDAKASTTDSAMIPAVRYLAVTGRVGARIPVVTRWLAVVLHAQYAAVRSSGEFGRMENYGGGSVAGVEFDAAVEWRPRPWLFGRVGGHYSRFRHALDGSGARTDAGNGATIDSVLDVYSGASFGVGVRL